MKKILTTMLLTGIGLLASGCQTPGGAMGGVILGAAASGNPRLTQNQQALGRVAGAYGGQQMENLRNSETAEANSLENRPQIFNGQEIIYNGDYVITDDGRVGTYINGEVALRAIGPEGTANWGTPKRLHTGNKNTKIFDSAIIYIFHDTNSNGKIDANELTPGDTGKSLLSLTEMTNNEKDLGCTALFDKSLDGRLIDLELINSQGKKIFENRYMLTTRNLNGEEIGYSALWAIVPYKIIKKEKVSEGNETFCYIFRADGNELGRKTITIQ